MPSPLFVLGAGGHAKVVISTLLAAGHAIDGVLDNDIKLHGKVILDFPILGPFDILEQEPDAAAVIAIGNNSVRRDIARRFPSIHWQKLIHPKAYVHDSSSLGPGTVVFAGAVIQPDVTLGAHVIINTSASVDHDCVIGSYTHVAPGCRMAGGVKLDEGVLLGVGSSVAPLISVAQWTTVGAGGVVVHDLPSYSVAVGVPARVDTDTRRKETKG